MRNEGGGDLSRPRWMKSKKYEVKIEELGSKELKGVE